MIEFVKGRVLLDFHAVWCGKCKIIAPLVTEAEKKITVIKVDADAEPEMVERFRVSNLPTLILLEDGQEVKRGGVEVLKEL